MSATGPFYLVHAHNANNGSIRDALAGRVMESNESELQKSLKSISWQHGNCLSCIWFSSTDPLNADLLDRARCLHPKLKPFELLVSGRDWCNLYQEKSQKQIDHRQEMALKEAEKAAKP
jgi:hypothetical protein